MSTPIEWLTQEIKHQRTKVSGQVVIRRDHPTYGYKKADIKAEFERLVGMLYALSVLQSGPSGAQYIAAREMYARLFAATDLDDSLDVLAARVKGA